MKEEQIMKTPRNEDVRDSHHCLQKTATTLSWGFLHTQKLSSKNMEDNHIWSSCRNEIINKDVCGG